MPSAQAKKNIYQRIASVMSAARTVAQDKTVSFGKSAYQYASHDAVTSEIRPLLIEHGVVMTTSLIEGKQEGNRLEATYAVTFVNIDDPEDSFTTNWIGYGIDNQDKGPGKACSYATKYAMLKTFCLNTGDDVEDHNEDYKPTNAKSGGGKPRPKASKMLSVGPSEIDGVSKIDFETGGKTSSALTDDSGLIEKCQEILAAEVACVVQTKKTAQGNIALIEISKAS